MADKNIIMFIWETGLKLIDLGKTLGDFLMQNITILGYSVSMWGLLGGVGIVLILIIKLAF